MSPEIHFRPDDLGVGGAPERGEGARGVPAEEIISNLRSYKEEIKRTHKDISSDRLRELNNWIKHGQNLLGEYLESAPGFEGFAQKIVDKTDVFDRGGKNDWGEYFEGISSTAQEFEDALTKEDKKKYKGIFEAAAQNLANKLDMKRKRASSAFGQKTKADARDKFEDSNFVPTRWFEERYNVNSLTGDMPAEAVRPPSVEDLWRRGEEVRRESVRSRRRDDRAGLESDEDIILSRRSESILGELKRLGELQRQQNEAMREQQSIYLGEQLTREEELVNFDKFERTGIAPKSPFTSRIFIKLNEGETRWMEARMILAASLSQKVLTFDIDKLYSEHPIFQLTVADMEFLLGAKDTVGVPTIRPEEYREGVKHPGIQGYLEALSLYVHWVENNVNLTDLFGKRSRDPNTGEERSRKIGINIVDENGQVRWEEARDVKKSFFEFTHKTDLDALTYNTAIWLMYYGRVRPTRANGQFSEDDLKFAQRVTRSAWDLFAQSNLVEEKDTRFNKKLSKGSKRLGPGMDNRLMHLGARIAVHPQERWEAKSPNDQAPWSDPLDQWSTYLQRRRESNFRFWRRWITPSPEQIDLLPKYMLRNAFEKMKDGYGGIFLDILNDNGWRLMRDPRGAQLIRFDFAGMKEGPFGGYVAQDVNAARTILGAITKGEYKWNGLARALNAMKVARKYRENIRDAIYVVKYNTYFEDSIRLRPVSPKGYGKDHYLGFVDGSQKKSGGQIRRYWPQRVAHGILNAATRWVDYI